MKNAVSLNLRTLAIAVVIPALTTLLYFSPELENNCAKLDVNSVVKAPCLWVSNQISRVLHTSSRNSSSVGEDPKAVASLANALLGKNPFLLAANSEKTYLYQLYKRDGTPIGMITGSFSPPSSTRRIVVVNGEELVAALANARPGDIIEPLPGTYHLNNRAISIDNPGTINSPIYLRAATLGKVRLLLNSLEGFRIRAPYWVFENLEIKGVCEEDRKCEHAFHVVGAASSFVLRNSRISEFNAAIKVNPGGEDGRRIYPDQGMLEYNAFTNTRIRNTDNPVALLNINSVNSWVVRGNFIADFVKGKGNQVSYGGYMKGNGSNGVFEQNFVMCAYQVPNNGETRLGLSFGGGGTQNKYCRLLDCETEHHSGIMRNNVILNCSEDVGIYLNRSANTKIYNNLLYNTLGIDVRFKTSTAEILNNLISGRVKNREGGKTEERNNLFDPECFSDNLDRCDFASFYANPNTADLRLSSPENHIWNKGVPLGEVTTDLCGNQRKRGNDLGPIQYKEGLDCLNY